MDDIHAEVSSRHLDMARAMAFCGSSDHGAIDVFVGRVRSRGLSRSVLGVTYDLHPALASRVLRDICIEARALVGGNVRLWLAHRHGRLIVGETSVIAVASAEHRKQAFRACRHMIEQMTSRAPIWKQEHYVDGDSLWIDGHPLQSSIA